MKTAFKIVIFVTITLVIGIILLISKSFLTNPYKSEIKYKTESFKSVRFEIPHFWKEYVNKSPTYSYGPKTNRIFEDGKDYVSIMISIEEAQWNQTVLENTCTQFLDSSISLITFYSSFSSQNEPCKIECKQEIYNKFKIKDFSESSEIKEKFDTCVKGCREESRKYNIETYGTTETNHITRQALLKDGSFFIAEAVGLNCEKDKVVYIFFAVNSNKISKDKVEEIRSHISNSIKCE